MNYICLLLFSFISIIEKINSTSILYRGKHNLDQSFYENLLDSELCNVQLDYLKNDTFLSAKFLDAGMRIPKGLLKGNMIDYGGYYECLDIHKEANEINIQGKYCMITIPLKQNITVAVDPKLAILSNIFNNTRLMTQISQFDNDAVKRLEAYYMYKSNMQQIFKNINNVLDIFPEVSSKAALTVAVCIPKPCTTSQVAKNILTGNKELGFVYEDYFCRLPNDKPWIAVDYVAISILSLILTLTILSTTYDVYVQVIKKVDAEKLNTLYISFSAYSNTLRLFKTESKSSTLHCVEGIRALAMTWVIIGHVITMHMPIAVNPSDYFDWLTMPSAVILTVAPIGVDTFFMMSGLFVVYTTAGKFTSTQLVKNLHIFYSHRLLRIYPLLAVVMLLQLSILYRIADGPNWGSMIVTRNNCLDNWWTNLLFIQNFMDPATLCLKHVWYVAVDMQLYLLSPLLLFWILRNNGREPWIATIGALLIFIGAITAFVFAKGFPSFPYSPSRLYNKAYSRQYYNNPLIRIPQYIIGMITGYILHLYRGKQLKIPSIVVTLGWSCVVAYSGLLCYSSYVAMQKDFNDQALDNVRNAFARPLWTLMIGWIILACVHGYGGPVNWFLSLNIWKLPSRLSYAVYLLHFPITALFINTTVEPIYFSFLNVFRVFSNVYSITAILAGITMIIIEYPFSVLIDLALGRGSLAKRKNQYACKNGNDRNI